MDQKKTLLVADDNAVIRRILRRTFEGPETEILEADDGLTALAAARIGQPDMLILDVRMPGLDGHEVCRALRAEEATRGLPILMLTGLGDVADEVAGLELGADAYVSKPFNLLELKARVNALLRRCAYSTEVPEAA